MRKQLQILAVICFIVVLGIAGCATPESEPSPTPTPTPVVEEAPTAEPTPVVEKAPTVEPTPVVKEAPTAEPTPVAEESPTPMPSPTVDPAIDIVLEMIERVNSEDYAGAAELVADDMMAYFIGMPPTGMEIYWGKDQFRTFLEECCTGQNFVWEVVPKWVSNGTVFANGKTWMDFTRDLGVAPNSFHEMFTVKEGKITQYTSIMNEETLARFKPALAEVIPELFEVVLPADETPAGELTITIADGTCAYSGPMTVQAGDVLLNVDVQDQHKEKYGVGFFTLDEGKDLIDLMASTNRVDPTPWSKMVFFTEVDPGESESYDSFSVEEGLLYMICFSKPPDVAIGNAGPFVVKP